MLVVLVGLLPIAAMAERVSEVDWSRLFHRFGPASDTPGHLKALLGDDPKAFVDGYTHLWTATLRREGRVWPVTASAGLLVTELLADPLLGPDDPSLRDAVLAYLHALGAAVDLGDAAEPMRARVEAHTSDLWEWTAAYLSADADGRAGMWEDGTGLGELVLDQATLACFDVAPELLSRVLPYLTSERVRRAAAAAAAVGALARHPSAAPQRPALLDQLAGMAVAVESPHELATVLIAIGHLDGDTRSWLADPNLGVRGCAALAPALADDDRATEVLREVASSPHAFARSFGGAAPPAQLQTPPAQNPLRRALRRLGAVGAEDWPLLL